MSGGVCLYLSEHQAKCLRVFAMSTETGELTPIQEVAIDGTVMPIAITPDRRFLFAALRNEPYRFARFAINASDGTLVLLGYTSSADSTAWICVDRSGRYLLGACNPLGRDRRTGIITVNVIGPDGELDHPPRFARTPPKLHSVLPDPSNRFLFGASCDGDQVLRYAFDVVTGRFSSDGLSPVLVLRKSGPRHMRFHPNGAFLYLVTEYDASVYAFRYGPTDGSLAELQWVTAVPPGYAGENPEAADLHLTPDGRWLFASVRDTPCLAAFAVDGLTGRLTAVGHFETAKAPRSFAIDPSGRFLFAAGETSARLVSYRIDSDTGTLTRLANYPVGDGPNWIEMVMLP